MKNRLVQAGLVGLLSAQLMVSGCGSVATIKRPIFEPLAAGRPVPEEQLQKIRKEMQEQRSHFVDSDVSSHFGQVMTGTESTPFGRQNDHANLAIRRHSL